MKLLEKLRRLSPPEVLAHHATNEDRWGPTQRDLHELSALSSQPKACQQILGIIEHRLRQSNRHWRQKSKSLTVLHYLLLNGNDHCLIWLRANSKPVLGPLLHFHYSDSKNVDQGLPVREKASTLMELVSTDEHLAAERENYLRQKEQMRTSIGRPSSSRHTLDLVRSDLGLETVMSPCNTPAIFSPPASPPVDRRRLSLSLCLDVIQEENS